MNSVQAAPVSGEQHQTIERARDITASRRHHRHTDNPYYVQPFHYVHTTTGQPLEKSRRLIPSCGQSKRISIRNNQCARGATHEASARGVVVCGKHQLQTSAACERGALTVDDDGAVDICHEVLSARADDLPSASDQALQIRRHVCSPIRASRARACRPRSSARRPTRPRTARARCKQPHNSVNSAVLTKPQTRQDKAR